MLVLHVAPLWVNAWIHSTDRYGSLPLPAHSLDRGRYGGFERIFYTAQPPDKVAEFYRGEGASSVQADADAMVLRVQRASELFTVVLRDGVWHGTSVGVNPLPGTFPRFEGLPGRRDRDEWIPLSSLYMR